MTALLLILFAPLVADLGHPSFRQREQAEAEIRSFGWLAVPALRVGRDSLDSEVAYRCRRLLARFPPESDVRILWLCFRSGSWVAGCEIMDLDPVAVDSCVRRWKLYAAHPSEPWPCGQGWSELEQLRMVLNFARMRANNPRLSWSSVPWSACLDPETTR